MTTGKRFTQAAKAAVVAIALTAGSVASYCGVMVLTGNFHTVEEGQLYRSAQLDSEDLTHAIAAHGIRSVLNLRGSNPHEGWYDEELATANALGVAHYDFALSAKRRVTPAAMKELLAIVRAAPKPLLIHCKSGADRTGLVAALYRYAVEGKSADDAAGELSLRYGHFPYLTSRSGAMDESFRAWVATSALATGG